MKIENHILTAEKNDMEVSFEETPNHSGEFNADLPDTLVIHYTAGRSLESSANWLKDDRASASAHLVIGKSGKVIQLVPFNKIAWHAGISKWKGRTGLNHFSIGIELDNVGKLEKRADGYYTSWGTRVKDENVVMATHKAETDEKGWEAYTEKQLEVLEQVCMLLKEKYAIREIVGHEDISPGRKTDPGPAFPMKPMVDKMMNGRKVEVEAEKYNRHRKSPGYGRSFKYTNTAWYNFNISGATIGKRHKTLDTGNQGRMVACKSGNRGLD